MSNPLLTLALAIPPKLALLANDLNAMRLVVAWPGLDYAGSRDALLFDHWAAAAGVPVPEVYRCAPMLRAHAFVREQRIPGIVRPARTSDPDAVQFAQLRLAAQLGARPQQARDKRE